MEHLNYSNFNWQDNMLDDKPLYLKNVKEKILNGNKTYRDLYIDSTYAFLAPDNYGVDDVNDIDIDENTQLQQASKEFDKVCKDIKNHFIWACQETNQLDLINKTSGWRVRDFISEAQAQSDKYSNSEHRPYAMWKRVVNVGNQILTDDMTCSIEHLSKYDLL